MKLCKIKGIFNVNIRPGTGDSAVEFNSPLDVVYGTALLNLTRH
jgi:hypothetical protein